jgi:hypothetical protein
VTPSIRFIKRHYPNAVLAKHQKATAVIPEVVFEKVDEDTGPKHLSKREGLNLKNDFFSRNRVEANSSAYLDSELP